MWSNRRGTKFHLHALAVRIIETSYLHAPARDVKVRVAKVKKNFFHFQNNNKNRIEWKKTKRSGERFFKWESRASGFVCSTRVTTFTAGPGQHARRRLRPTVSGSLFPVTDQSQKRKGWRATVDGPFNCRNRLRTRKVVRHSQLSMAAALAKWWATCRSASRKEAQPGKETIPVCFMGVLFAMNSIGKLLILF